MVIYPKFYGRMGNHLFQIAATVSLARDHNDSYGFPRWRHEPEFNLHGCFYGKLPEGPLYREPRYLYDPIPYQANLSLCGYFQSEKYFQNHADFVRAVLSPVGVPDRSEYLGTASLHVRRYIPEVQRSFTPLPMSYYEKAVGFLRTQRGISRFLVFSDDLPWCRNNFVGEPFEVIKDMPPARQLAITIACEHHIMANSTFSWWGAWLDPSPEKMVIAPAMWYGPRCANKTKDVFPEKWVQL